MAETILRTKDIKVTFLGVRTAGSGFGPPSDHIDAEVIVLLNDVWPARCSAICGSTRSLISRGSQLTLSIHRRKPKPWLR